MGKFIDLTDQVFGRLTAKYIASERSPQGDIMWMCECACEPDPRPDLVPIHGKYLRQGKTRSCGCINNTHYSDEPEWQVWWNLKDRCYNPKNQRWHRYGARGIVVCDRWLERLQGYLNFIEDMGHRPSPDHWIERHNNDGPYCKDNCRWLKRKNQARNKHDTIYAQIDGIQVAAADIRESVDMKKTTFYGRLKQGMTVEEALFTPVLTREESLAQTLIYSLHCKRCGGDWMSSVQNPYECKLCGNSLWDTDYKWKTKTER